MLTVSDVIATFGLFLAFIYYWGPKLDLPVNPSFFLQTPHFFFCFLAGGCEDSSSSGVFDSVVTLSDGFESISGVSAVGLEGGWGWVVGFDRIGFIRPAIASVTEPEVLSGVDSRAEFHFQKSPKNGKF